MVGRGGVHTPWLSGSCLPPGEHRGKADVADARRQLRSTNAAGCLRPNEATGSSPSRPVSKPLPASQVHTSGSCPQVRADCGATAQAISGIPCTDAPGTFWRHLKALADLRMACATCSLVPLSWIGIAKRLARRPLGSQSPGVFVSAEAWYTMGPQRGSRGVYHTLVRGPAEPAALQCGGLA